jgi:triacylglycerol lipase
VRRKHLALPAPAPRAPVSAVVADAAPLLKLDDCVPAPAAEISLPVVLVHGLLGFDELSLMGAARPYFRGVAERLRIEGAVVYTARLPPLGSVPARARALSAFIRTLPHPRVNVIAHSMGGLDARYAIVHFGLGERVASLITIGTPHRGSPVADLGDNVPGQAVRALIGRAGLYTDALDWLTTTRMAAFNDEVRNIDGVLYGYVLATTRRQDLRGNPILLPCYAYLRQCAGDNDGIVPASSQRWGEKFGEVYADHWAQVGWSRTFDAAAMYVELLRSLRCRGF